MLIGLQLYYCLCNRDINDLIYKCLNISAECSGNIWNTWKICPKLKPYCRWDKCSAKEKKFQTWTVQSAMSWILFLHSHKIGLSIWILKYKNNEQEKERKVNTYSDATGTGGHHLAYCNLADTLQWLGAHRHAKKILLDRQIHWIWFCRRNLNSLN